MSDDITEPPDPFQPIDAERIASEVGGEIRGTLQRANQDRLSVGFLKHPHNMRSLNQVAIRMQLDGKPTDAINLSAGEARAMASPLLQAASMCDVPPAQPDGD